MSDVQRPLKASEIVSSLQRAVLEHGDHPLYIRDHDTGWMHPIYAQQPGPALVFNAQGPIFVLSSYGYGADDEIRPA